MVGRVFRSRYLAWGTAALLLVGLVGLAASRPKDLSTDVRMLRSDVTSARSQASNLQTQVAGFQSEVTADKSALQAAQANALNAYALALATVKGQLASQTQALNQREQSLTGRERAVARAEGLLHAHSFSDGLFQVGKDIQPGTYHTTGAPDCYYALLGSSDTGNIISNQLSAGPQTVVINSPWFDSEGCGTWVPR
jgi:hypothetical protein